MLDTIFRRVSPEKASLPEKAVTGPGATVMSWGLSVSDAARSAQQMMKDAQAVYARGNRWVKRAEMTISGRVGSVAWHLEVGGESVNDDSTPELKAIRDLFESPLGAEDYKRQYPSQPRTRRELWGLTSRHMGLCNVGFWYLDELNGIGWPNRLFFLRPDRLTPRESGGMLVGWTLDKDSANQTDLSLEEVIPFYLDPPDHGHFGTGLVESIMSTVPLPNAIDRHAIDTLSSGGRLPGIYAPKEQATDDVFDRLVSDLRTIKDMPDSSKRDVVARAPINFTPTSSDMNSLAVTALTQVSRDDTLAHWGVPLSTIGGYTPAGMNSGDTRKYDEAALWQNAVQFRVDALFETIQYRLLDRLGMGLQLIIESPEFDDDAPKYELAKSAENLPLTNKERRGLIGLDPFGDPALDNAVVLPLNMVTYSTAPEVAVEGKASLPVEIANVRDKSIPRLKSEVAKVLAAIGKDIASRVRANSAQISRKPSDASVWLPASKRKEFEQALAKALNPHLALAADTVGAKVAARLGKSGKASVVLPKLMKSVGIRITGILDTTRDDVQRLIAQGLDEGMGAAELGDLIENATSFDEARAEMIARTETARALNESAIESYREYGVEQVQAIDGDGDEECAARDGQVYDLDEALTIEDHPNGTLDWMPIVGEKAAIQERTVPEAKAIAQFAMPQITIPLSVQMPEQPAPDMTGIASALSEQALAMKALADRPNPAPIVNVEAQPAPIVNIPAPIVNVAQPEKASMDVMDVRVVEMPDRVMVSKKTVVRDAQGLISVVDEKSVEETA